MRFENVCIESVAHVLPPHVVRSSDLEDAIRPALDRIGFPPGVIEKLTGVRERRWFDPGVRPSQVCTTAAERALAKAGISPDRVQACVVGSVSRDYLEPSTATLVAGNMGFGAGSINFDVTNACLGFLNGMLTIANMIELGQIDVGVVTAAEITRAGLEATLERLGRPGVTGDEFRDNFAALTLGSAGVGAVLVRRDLSKTGHRLHGAVTNAATEYNHLCVASHDEMRADAHGLLVHGVDCAVGAWPKAIEAFDWTPDTVDEVIFHQVGLTHFVQTFTRLELPLEKALVTFPYLGNTGPVSVPVTLAVGEAQGRIAPGKEVALFGVGSGLGSIILGVTW